jgi:hypothetical protein
VESQVLNTEPCSLLGEAMRHTSGEQEMRFDSELELEQTPQPAALPTDPEDVMWNSLLFAAITTMGVAILRVIRVL